MFHHQVAIKLSKPCRDLLLEHIDGGEYVIGKVVISNQAKHRSRMVLMDRGLIRYSGYLSTRPQSTRITADGREVLAWLLADAAEILVRFGFTGLESPKSLAVDDPEAGLQPTLADTPEPVPA